MDLNLQVRRRGPKSGFGSWNDAPKEAVQYLSFLLIERDNLTSTLKLGTCWTHVN